MMARSLTASGKREVHRRSFSVTVHPLQSRGASALVLVRRTRHDEWTKRIGRPLGVLVRGNVPCWDEWGDDGSGLGVVSSSSSVILEVGYTRRAANGLVEFADANGGWARVCLCRIITVGFE